MANNLSVTNIFAPEGAILVDSTHPAPNGGRYNAVTFVTASVVAVMSAERLGGVPVADFGFPAGLTLYTPFTYLTLASGTAIVYKG